MKFLKKTTVYVLVLAMFFCSFSSVVFADIDLYYDLISEGNTLYYSNITEAIKKYDQAIEEEPNEMAAYEEKASHLSYLERYDEAIETIDKAIINCSDDYSLLISKAEILMEKGDLDEAIAIIDNAIKQDASKTFAYDTKADILCEQGKTDEAIAVYDKVIKMNPNNYYSYNKKISFLKKIGRYEEAIKTIDSTISISPEGMDEQIYIDKVDLLLEMCRYKDSVASLNKAIAKQPNELDLLLKRASIYEEQTLYSEAVKDLDKVIKSGDADLKENAYESKANILSKQGKFDEVLKAYDLELKVSTDDYYILLRKAYFLQRINKLKDAIITCDKAIAIDDTDSSGFVFKTSILCDQGKYMDAIKLYKALLVKYQIPSLNEYIARIYNRYTKYADAIKALDAGLKLDPSNVNMMQCKAETLKMQKKYSDAIKILDNAIKIKPQNSSLYSLKADIFVEQKKYQDALNAIDAFNKVEPNDFSMMIKKGKIYYSWKKYAEAIKIYDSIISKDPYNTDAYTNYIDFYANNIDAYTNKGDAYTNKSDALLGLGKYKEAMEVLDKAITIKPSNIYLYIHKGDAMVKNKKYADAIKMYDMSIKADAVNGTAHYKKACAYALLKNTNKAIESLKKAISFDNDYIAVAKNESAFSAIKKNKDFKAIVK